MAMATSTIWFANKADKSGSRYERVNRRAGVACRTGPIHFACRNSRNANARTLSAPNRAVAIVNGDGRAVESLTGGNYRDRGEESEHSAGLPVGNRASKRG